MIYKDVELRYEGAVRLRAEKIKTFKAILTFRRHSSSVCSERDRAGTGPSGAVD